MDIALIGQQVFGLSEILRRGQRQLKLRPSLRRVALRQRAPAQRQVSPHMLGQGLPFSAFPWLEAAARNNLPSLPGPAQLIIERAQFDG